MMILMSSHRIPGKRIPVIPEDRVPEEDLITVPLPGRRATQWRGE